MQMPRIMRRVNRAITNRLMRSIAGVVPPLAVVHHVGRKSGRAYRTPVLAFPVAGGYVTPLPYGTDTDWCRNLLEARKGSFERLGRQIPVGNPRIVGADDAVPLLPAPLRPGLRMAGLPGYLLVDHAPRGAGGKAGARRPGRHSRRS
jgi:deazaflavin-dependent oxidoreductase (nitroreductase family)